MSNLHYPTSTNHLLCVKKKKIWADYLFPDPVFVILERFCCCCCCCCCCFPSVFCFVLFCFCLFVCFFSYKIECQKIHGNKKKKEKSQSYSCCNYLEVKVRTGHVCASDAGQFGAHINFKMVIMWKERVC